VFMVVLVGCALPFSPLACPLGFTPMPAGFFLFLVCMTSSFFLLVEVVKRRLMGRLLI